MKEIEESVSFSLGPMMILQIAYHEKAGLLPIMEISTQSGEWRIQVSPMGFLRVRKK